MSEDQVFSLDQALSRIDHDLDMFSMMVELFAEHAPLDFTALKAAVDARNPAAVAESAHRLKGSIMQFCAPATFEAAKKLEELGRAGDLTGSSDICAVLETELTRLLEALQRSQDKGLAA